MMGWCANACGGKGGDCPAGGHGAERCIKQGKCPREKEEE